MKAQHTPLAPSKGDHDVDSKPPRLLLRILGALGGGLFIVGIGFLAIMALDQAHAARQAEKRQMHEFALALQAEEQTAYLEYRASVAVQPLQETERDAPLSLDQASALFYDGVDCPFSGKGILFRVGTLDGRQIRYQLKPIPRTHQMMYYGDVSLLAELGLPIQLQVLRADPLMIKYAIVPNTVLEKN